MSDVLNNTTIQHDIDDAILLSHINDNIAAIDSLCKQCRIFRKQIVIMEQFDSLSAGYEILNGDPRKVLPQYNACCESIKEKVLSLVNRWKSVKAKFISNLGAIAKQLKMVMDDTKFEYKLIDDPLKALKLHIDRYSKSEFDSVVVNLKNCADFRIKEDKTSKLKYIEFEVFDTSTVDLDLKKRITVEFNKSTVLAFVKDYLVVYEHLLSVTSKLQQILDFIEKDSAVQTVVDKETKDNVTRTTTTTTVDHSKQAIYQKVGERVSLVWRYLHKLENVFRKDTRQVLSMHHKQKEVKA